MKKITSCILSLILLLAVAIPVSAAVIPDAVVDPERSGNFYLTYEDTVEGTTPVVGAEFTLYKIADLTAEGGFESLIPGIDYFEDTMDTTALLQTVKEAYQTDQEGFLKYVTETSATGQCDIQGVDLGLYLVEESRPSKEHFASIPFFASFPYTEDNQWHYDVLAEPKSMPAGDLIVKKTVIGRAGDTKKDFHFTIVFGDGYSEPIHYLKSTGDEGFIRSGDTITLKHNQTATLDTIPVGLPYTVTETEANRDGYITTTKDAEGKIYRRIQMTAEFTNTKNPDVETGDSYTYLIAGGIALVCIILAIILIIVLRKKKKNQEQAS